MVDKLSDPIGRLMGLRYKSHPWHGVFIGKNAPQEVTAFIEVVSTDTVKYEIDKESGYLRLDRPQKFSNVIPALYGFIPQTFCGVKVGGFCSEKTGQPDIEGDGDPIDICVLTEKTLAHGDLLVNARPIGGFRMIDGRQADDKIIAVLLNDTVYGHFKEMSEVPAIVIQRLEHYFLTYKDMPGHDSNTEIAAVYDSKEAFQVIELSMQDYNNRFDNLGKLLA
jgi:inorganic pyrophosphatase